MDLTDNRLAWQCTATIDASDLGLPPGEFPNRIRVQGVKGPLFLRKASINYGVGGAYEAQLQSVTYIGSEEQMDLELTVMND